ncbi:GNAT family N-acetyltransferase [Chitinimonas sp.]|uniref:GNAT family N-acetyltransferase n=1 Tax=Chitinimonas sp. TaxID=1934313 RepID=UPI002F94EE85
MIGTVIRIALPADADSLTQRYRELVDDPAIRVLPERLAELAAHPDHALLVLERAGELLATAHLLFFRDAMYAEQPYALVENVVVAAEARGQGLGRHLFEEIDRRCLARNCSKIMLLSNASRVDAHRFFAAQGYQGDRKRGFVRYRRDMQTARPVQ